MDCLICYCPVENPVSCGDPACEVKVCGECCAELIKYSAANSLMPQCPSTDCSSYYLYSDTCELGVNVAYRRACYDYVIKEHGSRAQKKIERDNVLRKLREERRTFIRDSFPAAIALVAEVAMKNKLRKLEKSKAQSISDNMNNAKRRCMNLFCNGFLNEELECLSCDSKFCKKCEKRKTPEHVCKQQDIESVDFIRAMIHCPHCDYPIEKWTGCNHVTCAHCGKHFDYGTGQAGTLGSNNEQLTEMYTKRRISIIYAEYVNKSELQKIERLEALEPPQATMQPIINIITKHYKGDTKKITRQRLAKALDRYLSITYKRRLYHRVLADIEDTLQKDGLGESIDKALDLVEGL